MGETAAARFRLGMPDTDLVRIIVIAALTISSILIATLSLSQPISLVSTQLFFIPIIYAVYVFGQRGLYVAALCALGYQTIGYFATYPNTASLIAISSEAVLFVVIGVVLLFFFERIREGEVRYRTIYEHSQLGILLFDLSTFSISHANQKLLAMLNYAQGELAGKTLPDLLLTPREKERFLERIKKETTTSDFETRFATKTGATCWVNLSWDRIDESTISCTIININSRKLAEKLNNDNMLKYRTLAESTPTSILIVQDGAIRYTNPSFIAFLGYSMQESIGKDLGSFIEPEDQARYRTFLEERSVKKLGTMNQVFRFVSKSGRTCIGTLLTTPIRHLDNPAMLVNIIDITEKQRLEDQIRLDNERRRGVIVTVAHELRTPLQPILGYLNLLLSDPEGFGIQDDTKKILDRCLTSVDRERQIINQMLDLSVLESGKIQLAKTDFPLAPLVKKVIEGGGYATKATVTVDIKEGVVLHADIDRLYNVLDSILTNAVNFSKAPRRIDVSYTSGTDESEHLISIRDNGVGIAQDQIDSVFEPFQLADGTNLSRKYDRLGLSLSIVKKILEMHGGAITVESVVNAGSTFTIHLPRGNAP